MNFRAFICVEVDARPLTEVMNALKGLKGRMKFVEPENVHLTLKFLGNTDEALIPDIKHIMDSAVEGYEQFEVEMQGIGAFPSMQYVRVVWVGLRDAEKLKDIASYIDEKLVPLGFKREKRGFSPHITIARVKSVGNKRHFLETMEAFKDTRFATIKVDRIKLKRSVLSPKGPTYYDVAESLLGAKAENP